MLRGAGGALDEAKSQKRRGARWFGFLLGPAVFAAMNLLPPQGGMEPAAWRTASVGAWVAIWWAVEAAPVPVTALLPLVLFAPLSISTLAEAAAPFANPIIYLYLGGFMLALAIERSGLHRRIALAVLGLTGTDGRRLIAGFMLTAALLSMWMTNTSTSMVLLPICISVATTISEATPPRERRHLANFRTALLIGLAYAATIGGLATLVGTPPNALLAAFLKESYAIEIDFLNWMLVGVPVTIVMLPLAWLLLVRWVFPFQLPATPEAKRHLAELKAGLGPMTQQEKRVAVVFACVVLAWVFRRPLNALLGGSALSDPGIVMTAAVLLFIIPRGGGRAGALMDWEQAARLPWGVLLLFGGGLSLAAAVSKSGLALWLGESLTPLGAFGVAALVLGATLLVIFLTEMTSNLATTATLLPVIGAMAVALSVDPLLLTVPVTLAASCAFMLPVATPPNAIVYASGMVTIPQMARAGLLLNLLGAVLVLAVGLLWAPLVLAPASG